LPDQWWVLGYPIVVGIMATIPDSMLFFFWRRGSFD